jgi:soluble P-type ATPase
VRRRGILFGLPGATPRRLDHLVADFNGTLAADGRLLPGVAARLRRLARKVDITVLTADTFGTARRALATLPVATRTVQNGGDKRRFVKALGRGVVAVGNGRNDVPMFHAAALAIAIVGPEGAAPELLHAASVVVADIRDALNLLLHPRRLTATLRS